MRSVFRVTLPGLTRAGAPRFVFFECNYASLAALAADLTEDTIVNGHQLITRRQREDGGEEVEVIKQRFPYAIGKAGIATIETPQQRFIEYEEDGDGQEAS